MMNMYISHRLTFVTALELNTFGVFSSILIQS